MLPQRLRPLGGSDTLGISETPISECSVAGGRDGPANRSPVRGAFEPNEPVEGKASQRCSSCSVSGVVVQTHDLVQMQEIVGGIGALDSMAHPRRLATWGGWSRESPVDAQDGPVGSPRGEVPFDLVAATIECEASALGGEFGSEGRAERDGLKPGPDREDGERALRSQWRMPAWPRCLVSTAHAPALVAQRLERWHPDALKGSPWRGGRPRSAPGRRAGPGCRGKPTACIERLFVFRPTLAGSPTLTVATRSGVDEVYPDSHSQACSGAAPYVSGADHAWKTQGRR